MKYVSEAYESEDGKAYESEDGKLWIGVLTGRLGDWKSVYGLKWIS